jgi:hypothetical protein
MQRHCVKYRLQCQLQQQGKHQQQYRHSFLVPPVASLLLFSPPGSHGL